MKRTACILIIFALLCGSSACADRHMEIRITPAGNPDAAMTFDLYEQEEAVYTLSSLFPGYVYRSGLQEGISVSDLTELFSMLSGLASEADRNLSSRFTQWLDKRLSDPESGTWAGELFENASSVRTAEFRPEELTALFDAQSVQCGTQETEESAFTESMLYKMISGCGDTGLTVSVSSFDDGKYFTAAVLRRDGVIMTISADCSEEGAKRVLVSYREEGKYYFRDTALRYDADSFSVTSMFYGGDDTSSLKSDEARLLFTETFSAKNETDHQTTFECTFMSPALGDPVVVTGSAAAADEGFAAMEAAACIGSGEVIRISVSEEPLARQVAFTDKETVTADEKNGSDGILLSATPGLMLFAAEILPALPYAYRNLFMSLPLQ